MDMDLGVIRQQVQDDAWVTITHPVTGVETSLRIRLLNPDSQAYHLLEAKLKNVGIQQIGQRRNISAEELEENSLQLLIGATRGWENVVFDGQQLEFSPANVRTLYTDFPFIREQVDRFLGDRRNFFMT